MEAHPCRQRLIETFLDLVRIDSESLQEREIQDYLRRQLEAIGFQVEEDDAGRRISGNAGNLIARWPATDPHRPPLFFNAHVDTVKPGKGVRPQILEDGTIAASGDTVLGGDDKAGVVVLLEALRVVHESGLPHGIVEVVYTVAEEIGLLGAKALDLSSFQAPYAFVLDGGTPIGKATLAAPSHINLSVRLRGKAAHAGVRPEAGINAIQMAATAIASMRLGRIDEETTANVGIIQGGTATNIVPEWVEVRAEARSHSEAKLRRQIAHMRRQFEEAAYRWGGQVEIREERIYNAFRVSQRSQVCRHFRAACRRLGLNPLFAVSGGGSDANIFNERGLPAIVIACGQQNVHTFQERVHPDDLVKAVELVLAIFQV